MRGQHQAFIDDRLRAEAREINIQQFAFKTTADHENLALQSVAGQSFFRHDENLPNGGTALTGLFTKLCGVRRNIAPCENLAAFLFNDGFQGRFFADAVEHHAQRILASGRQGTFQFTLEEIMWNHTQKPSTVAGKGVTASGSAVQEPPKNGQTLHDNGMCRLTVQVGDETDATRVMLVAEVVQPFVLRQRQATLSEFQFLFHSLEFLWMFLRLVRFTREKQAEIMPMGLN